MTPESCQVKRYKWYKILIALENLINFFKILFQFRAGHSKYISLSFYKALPLYSK